MTIEVFVLCDSANDSGGKLNLLGAFNTMMAYELPAIHPFCMVALRLRFERSEQGSHRLTLNIKGPDGRQIIPPMLAECKVKVFGESEPTVVNVFFQLAALQLAHFGVYSVAIEIDGKSFSSTPLFVKNPKTLVGSQDSTYNKF